MQHADGSKEQYEYDERGLKRSKIDRAGVLTQFKYDAHGNEIEVACGGNVWLRNPRGEIATQEFDRANRQVGFTSFEGWSHRAGYDAVGRVIWKETPVGRQVFAFDDLNRLESVEQPDGTKVNLTYDPFTVDLDGVAFKRETNRVGNVVSEVQAIHELRLHWQGGYCDAIVADVGVPMLRNRDRVGDIEIIEAGGALFAHFDRAPSTVLVELGSALVLRKTYDALGQLAGQCLARLDRNLEPEQRATRSDPGVLWWASYEWRGTRLVGEHFSDGRSIQYELDACDRIRTRRVTRAGSVVEEERLHYDAAGAPLMPGVRYDAVGRPIGSAIEVAYYLSSPIGFPVSAVDATGREVWRAEPTAFGEARATGSVEIDVRFPNQHADEDVGLVYNFRRWYDPRLGLFISPDPELLEGNLIPRGYVDDPTVQSDPLGLKAIPAADQLPTAAVFLSPGRSPLSVPRVSRALSTPAPTRRTTTSATARDAQSTTRASSTDATAAAARTRTRPATIRRGNTSYPTTNRR